MQALEIATDQRSIVHNFLSLLRRRKQFRLLPKILQAFEREWNTRHGIFSMTVSYPPKFENSIELFSENIGKKLGKKIEMKKIPSEKIIGGARVHMEDTVIDASIEGQLKKLELHLN